MGIPSEVSVVGFDDIPAASLFWPGLTTVRQQMRAMGAAACRTLLTALLEEQPERSVLEFPMDLVVRQSTGPAPRAALP
ncbi:MAG: substrate-binding domain-containing protein [Pseudomonadota bacterium]